MTSARYLAMSRRLLAMAAFLVIILHTIKPDLLTWMEFPLPYIVRGLAFPLSLGGVALLAWAAQEATACPQRPGQRTLVTTGVHALVRHPLYSAAFATIPALTFLSANWFVGLLGLGLAINLYLRSRREDRELAETFGHAFAAYVVSTPAFPPRRARRPAPAA